jgi:hypothetical protein
MQAHEFATALAQALVATIALIAGLGLPWNGPAEILMLNGFFVALWLTSAGLFGKAAREHPRRPLATAAVPGMEQRCEPNRRSNEDS